jgi:hypothetical protein
LISSICLDASPANLFGTFVVVINVSFWSRGQLLVFQSDLLHTTEAAYDRSIDERAESGLLEIWHEDLH